MGDYNSTLNFIFGSSNNSIDLNDNEYIQIKAYNSNSNMSFIHNKSYEIRNCSK